MVVFITRLCLLVLTVGLQSQAERIRRVAASSISPTQPLPQQSKNSWIRAALPGGWRLRKTAIEAATATIAYAEDLVRDFSKIKHALGVISAAGPFTGMSVDELAMNLLNAKGERAQPIKTLKLGQQVGEGEWGQVYLSSDSRAAVIKVDKKTSEHWRDILSISPIRGSRYQLKHEALMQWTAHDHGISVPPVLGVGTINTPGGDHDALVMGIVGGKSLHNRTLDQLTAKAQRTATKNIVINLMKLLANGIVNSDQGPTNIMVDEAGHVTFIDFGMARFKEEFDGDEAQFLVAARYMVKYGLECLPPAELSNVFQDDDVLNHVALLPDELKVHVFEWASIIEHTGLLAG